MSPSRQMALRSWQAMEAAVSTVYATSIQAHLRISPTTDAADNQSFVVGHSSLVVRHSQAPRRHPMTHSTPPPIIDFTRYVAERTQDFAGRAWVFQALDAWLADAGGPRCFV